MVVMAVALEATALAGADDIALAGADEVAGAGVNVIVVGGANEAVVVALPFVATVEFRPGRAAIANASCWSSTKIIAGPATMEHVAASRMLFARGWLSLVTNTYRGPVMFAGTLH